MQFRSLTSVQHLRQTLNGDIKSALYIYGGLYDNADTYYSQEFQLLGHTQTLEWVAGVYGGIEDGRDGTALPGFPALFGSGANVDYNQFLYKTAAVYAQGTWEFLPEWHLTAGARYSMDWRKLKANHFASVYPPNPNVLDECVVPAPGVDAVDPADPSTAQCPRTFSANFKKPTWLVSLDHQITPGILGYGKIATGYRSGGLNADSGEVNAAAFLPFQPETNIEYEVGLKSDLFDHRARLNVALFWDQYSNLQEKTTTFSQAGDIITAVTSAGKARTRGMEAEGDVLVTDNLELHATAAYTEAKYLRFIDALGDHSNRPFAVPKWTIDGSVHYTHPTGIGDASLEVDYIWKSSIDVVNAGPSIFRSANTQPGYGLLNARVNLHVDAWNFDIAVFGQNLTDEFYIDQGFDLSLPGAGFAVDVAYVGGAPRTFGLEIIKKFGE